jgi:hypothetical protein
MIDVFVNLNLKTKRSITILLAMGRSEQERWEYYSTHADERIMLEYATQMSGRSKEF